MSRRDEDQVPAEVLAVVWPELMPAERLDHVVPVSERALDAAHVAEMRKGHAITRELPRMPAPRALRGSLTTRSHP